MCVTIKLSGCETNLDRLTCVAQFGETGKNVAGLSLSPVCFIYRRESETLEASLSHVESAHCVTLLCVSFDPTVSLFPTLTRTMMKSSLTIP